MESWWTGWRRRSLPAGSTSRCTRAAGRWRISSGSCATGFEGGSARRPATECRDACVGRIGLARIRGSRLRPEPPPRMPNTIQGNLDARGSRFAVVVSRFNAFISDRLLAGALDALDRSGAASDAVTIIRVPGAFEIPLTAKKLADSRKYDAVICLGALLRGDTPHFDYISSTVTKDIGTAGLDSGIPVIYGVLTCDTVEQAVERAGLKSGNKGFEAALAAIEMVQVMKQI